MFSFSSSSSSSFTSSLNDGASQFQEYQSDNSTDSLLKERTNRKVVFFIAIHSLLYQDAHFRVEGCVIFGLKLGYAGVIKGTYANLNHYDFPLALMYIQRMVGAVKRRELCFKELGDIVKNWMTFNVSRVIAALGYSDGLDIVLLKE
ncbi:hypothetical protein LguiA_021017 [Lonicera macranthoides]